MGSRVNIGMVLYNDQDYLNEAVDSLLAQTYKEFKITLCDDCSTDATGMIAKQRAEQDDRLTYFRNEERLGLAANSRLAYDRSEPCEYFAWAAGHDKHHPRWLEEMVKALDETPEAVIAYPLTKRIDGNNEEMNVQSPEFENVGQSAKQRIRSVCLETRGFGDLIYGLFRADALRKVGVFRSHIYPDVLLLLELSISGSFKQVTEKLWYRRHVKQFSVARQRRTVFSACPWYGYLPWPIAHFGSIAKNRVLNTKAGSLRERALAFYLMWMSLVRAVRKGIRKSEKRLRAKKSNINLHFI